MPKKPFLFAIVVLLLQVPAAFPGPPEGPSGRTVQDAVPALQDEVRRLEKAVARDKGLAEELDVARANLAAAQGRTGEARAAWQKIIATHEERLARLEARVRRGLDCDPSDIAIYRGAVVGARCGLAEVEGDRVALARELPKVITYREMQLARLRRLAKTGVISPDEVEQGEKALLKDLRQARRRLDAVRQR
jgi:hypothetical protein